MSAPGSASETPDVEIRLVPEPRIVYSRDEDSPNYATVDDIMSVACAACYLVDWSGVESEPDGRESAPLVSISRKFEDG